MNTWFCEYMHAHEWAHTYTHRSKHETVPRLSFPKKSCLIYQRNFEIPFLLGFPFHPALLGDPIQRRKRSIKEFPEAVSLFLLSEVVLNYSYTCTGCFWRSHNSHILSSGLGSSIQLHSEKWAPSAAPLTWITYMPPTGFGNLLLSYPVKDRIWKFSIFVLRLHCHLEPDS